MAVKDVRTDAPQVCPAPAGMSPDDTATMGTAPGLPRASGDEPDIEKLTAAVKESAPRQRG